MEQINYILYAYLIPFGWKLLGAIALWVVGGWVIKLIDGMIVRLLDRRKFEPTIGKYIANGASLVLRLLLVIAILGMLGVETTSLAALLAAAGVAIGAAWGGLLANFAAGVFLVVLRPFKVGDAITAGGMTGEVKEIGLFATTLDTPDGLRAFVGNNKILSDSIVNYSANPYRRVELTVQLAHGVDVEDAMRRLRERLAAIPNVAQTPAPVVEILSFSPYGPVLAVRPSCNNQHYGQVVFDTNRAIVEVSGQAGYPMPEQRIVVRKEKAVTEAGPTTPDTDGKHK